MYFPPMAILMCYLPDDSKFARHWLAGICVKVHFSVYTSQTTTYIDSESVLVLGNVIGLKGFRVELMKTSYPVGFHECSKVLFGHELGLPSYTSEVRPAIHNLPGCTFI